MIVFGNAEHAKIIARAVGCGFDPDVHFVIAHCKPQLLGGVIYTDYTGPSVMAHIAGFDPRWMTPHLLWVIHDFPFNLLKVRRIFVSVLSTNKRSMSIAQKMGFKWVAAIPDVAPGRHMDVLSMSRDECKYLKLGWRYAAMENAA